MNLAKLHRPKSPADFLARERLHRLLDEGVAGPLTLVSASAGYGKSQLVSHWLSTRPEPSAWLALEDDDKDTRGFLEEALAAVRGMWPEACRETALLLAAHELAPVPALARSWLNGLEEIGSRSILVLDDFQCVRGSAVIELVDALLAHASPMLHLVLITRSDPALDLARMRGSGLLMEVRAQDLRFDAAETRAFLLRSADFTVTKDVIAHLDRTVEGWPAGLRLARLAARHQPDPNGFLAVLEGSLPSIRDYLIGQALAAQPRGIQHYLTRTSILDQLCAPLCDAVCRPDDARRADHLDGRAFLEHSRAAGLFMIDLDATGEWYRYHHLFQEALREQLAKECSAAEIARLHGRACQWFEEHDRVVEAIGQALSAGQVDRAAGIIDRNRLRVLDQDRPFDLSRWLAMLPEEARLRHPGLLLAQAWTEFEAFRTQELANLLERFAELDARQLDPEAAWAELEFLRGIVWLYRGESARSLECFTAALEGVPERSDSMLRSELELQYGLALHFDGRTEEALQALERWLQSIRPAANVRSSRLIAGRALVHLFAGELARASNCAEQLAGDAERLADPYLTAWSSYLRGSVALQWCHLEPARELLRNATRHRFILHHRAAVDSCAALALACELDGSGERADEAIAMAQDLAAGTGDTEKIEVARSAAARLALLRGDVDAALQWLRSSCASPDVANTLCWCEAPCITECRVLVATGAEANLHLAVERLERTSEIVGSIHNAWHRVDLAALRALALHRLGRLEEARELLEEGLGVAVAGGWIRPFVELGAPMAELLRERLREGSRREHVEQVLAAFGARGRPSREQRSAIVEPLTTREEQILEMLAQRLRDKEIAQALHVSPQTVKTHLKHIYQKLGVGGRREAVSKGRSLGLLVER